MGQRTDLHAVLCNILGSNHVYFQPPENIKLVYPCIVYSREPNSDIHADDSVYVSTNRYSLTVIDQNPDTAIPDNLKCALKKYVKMDRVYVSANLNHYHFTIYY